MNRKKLIYSLLLLFVLIFCTCKPKPNDTGTQESDMMDYPMYPIPNIISINLDSLEILYPLSEDFIKNFKELAVEYEGMRVLSTVQFPEEWGIICSEQLPGGRELWQIQSQDRLWKYLVITSGWGTQRVLDILPVAIDLSRQDSDIIETEIWKTERQSDGSFWVHKKYDWLKSIAHISRRDLDSNRANYQQSKELTDKYIINDMSRFEYLRPVDTIEYEAIVFYFDPETKPEEWDDCMLVLQSYCEENNIFFEEAGGNYSQIRIMDFMLNNIAVLNITKYMGPTGAGMVMFKTGKEPKDIRFGNPETMKIEIRRYFELLNQEFQQKLN
jgi:hypothetical protein